MIQIDHNALLAELREHVAAFAEKCIVNRMVPIFDISLADDLGVAMQRAPDRTALAALPI